MRFVTGHRAVVMNVGEFATFRPGPADIGGGRSGAWRTAVGTAWHQTLRQQAAAATPDASFELPVAARLLHRAWTVELQGRIDQALPREDSLVLREIKTVSITLPKAEEELQREYPEYFRQLAAYRRLAELDPALVRLTAGRPLAAELVFVDYSAGVTQTVAMDAAAASGWVERQLDALLPYLEFRWSSRQRLAALTERRAFAELRPGQAEARAALADSRGQAGVVVFEAPTGFGKTGLLLEYALERLREGHCQRLLYLTGKGTGQAPVTRQLRALLGAEPELRHIQLRSRREHAIATEKHICEPGGDCRADIAERWEASGLSVLELFEDGTLPLEKSRTLGGQTGVCPYEITRAALPYAEVWVCDYNYIFSPAHRSVLFNQAGFDPALTLLVLDEAHNLPARAAAARSHILTADAARLALDSCLQNLARPALTRAVEHLADFLAPLRPASQLDLTNTYSLADLLENILSELHNAPLPEAMPETVRDFLWGTTDILGTLRDDTLELLPWCPAPGTLSVTCLDAAPAIATALREFGQSVLTSATFGPPELFLPSCGLTTGQVRWIAATAPWRDGAYEVAVDARVDTRLRARPRYYAATAETIQLLAAGQGRPVAIFFPSYDYAEAVRAYLATIDPMTRVAMQPRGATLAEQGSFIDDALLTAHAIFFVLGGSFAEGVDQLGGTVERAMIVGPALPEPNAVNEARRARLEEKLGAEEAFRRVYLAPGMLKIAQALGRLVRAPGQRAKILLHCRRFADPATQSLLAPEYRTSRILRSDQELAGWVE